MATLIDISMPLQADMPAWPGTPGLRTSSYMAIAAGQQANATQIVMDAHSGTHIDAPRHFIDDGATVDKVGLDVLVGPAWVADATGAPYIDRQLLESLDIPSDTARLLLQTDNSFHAELRRSPFRKDYVALTADAAEWVVERGLMLVGIDFLSIQRFDDPPDAHLVLLRAGVVILEGLDLHAVACPARWRLVCLPLSIPGIEAAPARAVLLSEDAGV